MVVPPLVPELQVVHLDRALAFYLDVLGFNVAWSRSEEGFAYLQREEAAIMFEQAGGPGRRITTGPLDPPFGRGVNFQIAVADIEALSARVAAAGYPFFLPLEERSVRTGTERICLYQIVVADCRVYPLQSPADAPGTP